MASWRGRSACSGVTTRCKHHPHHTTNPPAHQGCVSAWRGRGHRVLSPLNMAYGDFWLCSRDSGSTCLNTARCQSPWQSCAPAGRTRRVCAALPGPLSALATLAGAAEGSGGSCCMYNVQQQLRHMHAMQCGCAGLPGARPPSAAAPCVQQCDWLRLVLRSCPYTHRLVLPI